MSPAGIIESTTRLYLSFDLATLREDQARDGEHQPGDDGHGEWLAQQDDRGGRRDGGDKVDVRRRDHGAEPAHRHVPGYEARRGGDQSQEKQIRDIIPGKRLVRRGQIATQQGACRDDEDETPEKGGLVDAMVS